MECGGFDMEYLAFNEMSIKWNILSCRVRKLCEEGRGAGAVQKSNLWLIPVSAIKPDGLQKGRKK